MRTCGPRRVCGRSCRRGWQPVTAGAAQTRRGQERTRATSRNTTTTTTTTKQPQTGRGHPPCRPTHTEPLCCFLHPVLRHAQAGDSRSRCGRNCSCTAKPRRLALQAAHTCSVYSQNHLQHATSCCPAPNTPLHTLLGGHTVSPRQSARQRCEWWLCVTLVGFTVDPA